MKGLKIFRKYEAKSIEFEIILESIELRIKTCIYTYAEICKIKVNLFSKESFETNFTLVGGSKL